MKLLYAILLALLVTILTGSPIVGSIIGCLAIVMEKDD